MTELEKIRAYFDKEGLMISNEILCKILNYLMWKDGDAMEDMVYDLEKLIKANK